MFLERFIQYIKFEKRYSPHTVSAYQIRPGAVHALFEPLEGNPESIITHPGQISYHDIRNWMVELMGKKLL
jgi:integrase/recombinase XerC